MKRMMVAVLCILILVRGNAQQKIKQLQDFMNESGIHPTQVMLAGTFHFAYQNLDQHKTDKRNMRNILSEKSQQELQELLNVFRAYKPTRIYLESNNQQWLDSCYNVCNEQTFKMQTNERVQLGFRLAKELKLAKVYAIDAGELINDWNNADSNLLAKVLGSDSIADKAHANLLNRAYNKYYEYSDSLNANISLLDAFVEMNSPRNIQLSHGVYLGGYFNTLGNYGPDFLSTWWVDRNLRIFNNVLLTKPTGNDRILLLFGAGHVPLLKQNFESSAEFEWVDFYNAAVKLRAAKKHS